MPIRRRILCHHCAIVLTRDERDHYGYQCHGCVMREHELALLAVRDPHHPDIAWLEASPVTIGPSGAGSSGHGRRTRRPGVRAAA